MRMTIALTAAALLVASTAAVAASPTFTTIDNPGDPTFNQLLSIENDGVIAGYFGSGQAGHPNQAYLTRPPYTGFVPHNVPGSVQTQVTTISGAFFGGFWSGTNIGMVNGVNQDANYGFLHIAGQQNHGEFVLVNAAANGVPATAQVLGVNATGDAVGFYIDSDGNSHGFEYASSTGVYTPIHVPGGVQVTAAAINASNLIAGSYIDKAGVTHAFLRPLTDGTPIHFTVPGAHVTAFAGVNARGVAVGFYQLSDGVSHGLLYNPSNGQWQTLDSPNAPQIPGGGTTLNGLNDEGSIVGFYIDAAGNTHGLLISHAF